VASAGAAMGDVERTVILGENEVLTLPNGQKIVLTDDDIGSGAELWYGGRLVRLRIGEGLIAGQFHVRLIRHDMKGDRVKLIVSGPPLPRKAEPGREPRIPPRHSPAPNPSPRPPRPGKLSSNSAESRPAPRRRTPDSATPSIITRTIEDRHTGDPPMKTAAALAATLAVAAANAFEFNDKTLASDKFAKLGSETNAAGLLGTKLDLAGDPGYALNITLFGEKWQDIDLGAKEVQGFDDAEQYVMTLYNPNGGWFAANLCVRTKRQYHDTGWHWISPRQRKTLILDLDNVYKAGVLSVSVRIASNMGEGPKHQMLPGRPFQVHIVPRAQMPPQLEAAEADLIPGGSVSVAKFGHHFGCEPSVPSEYAFRFHVVKGLYAWRIGLGAPDATRWRETAEDAFMAAHALSTACPYSICPASWTPGCKTTWMMIEEQPNND
jgi:hypothetical protein